MDKSSRIVIRKQMARTAAMSVCSSTGFQREIIASIAENFYSDTSLQKTAFLGMTRKLGQIVEAFKKAPDLFKAFKKAVGIESLADIPGAIKRLAESAKKVLGSAIHKMFESWPLKIYTLDKGKLTSFNKIIESILDKSPKLKGFLESATRKISDFGEMIRKQAPRIIGVVMLGVYIWVWLNVTEFEWDLKSLADAVSGRLTFPDFMASLPGSAFGLLLNGFGFGTFTLLPYTIAARFLYLLANRYIEWDGNGFSLVRENLQKDFGIQSFAQG